MTTVAPVATIAQAFVNTRAARGRLATTGSTCQDFIHDTAVDVTEVLYTVKSGKINSTSPGAFFYYTRLVAPGERFTIRIEQSNNSAAMPLFDAYFTNPVRLYREDCTSSRAQAWINTHDGQTTIEISRATPGEVIIVSVKYKSSSIVGTWVYSPYPPVHYDFVTKVNGMLVDQDVDGLRLRKK